MIIMVRGKLHLPSLVLVASCYPLLEIQSDFLFNS